MAERRIGILIASSQFPDEPKLEALRYPEDDVDGLKEVLISKERGGFDNVIILKNKPSHEILIQLNLAFKKAAKEDLILVYYSGHGKCNSTGRLHLATPNTTIEAMESTSVSASRIKDFIEVSRTNKIIIILDCCYGGAIGREFIKGSVDDQLQMVSKGRGTYIMTASTEFQVAKEIEADQHGIFTKHIINGIKNGDADLDNNGRISINELYDYVHKMVTAECHQEPEMFNPSRRGDLVIARSGKSTRKKRCLKLRDILFDLGKQGLQDDILTKALEIIRLEPAPISGVMFEYDQLLEKLFRNEINPFDFAKAWYEIRKGIDRTAEPTALPSPPKKDRHLIIFAIIAIAALITGDWLFNSYITRTQTESIVTEPKEEKQPKPKQPDVWNGKFEQILSKLDQQNQQVPSAPDLNQLKSIENKRTENKREWEKLQQDVPNEVNLDQWQTRFSTIDQQWHYVLETRQKELVKISESQKQSEILSPQSVKIFVKTIPQNATVKIMNIAPEFSQGMELTPGNYHLRVIANGYEAKDFWRALDAGKDKHIEVKLNPIVEQPKPVLKPSEGHGIKVRLKSKNDANAPVAEEVNLYSKSYALVIGIDDYSKGWSRLSNAVFDAEKIADGLQKKGFEVTLEKNLSSMQLKDVFEEFFIFKGDDPEARLLIWFGGYGHTIDGNGFLIPADAPSPEDGPRFKYMALSMRRFGEFVRLAKSKHTLAVFDSCFSGTIFSTSRSRPPAAITRMTTFPVRQFLTSGDAGQTVSDDGRFRKLFLRAINGEDDADFNKDGYLTGSELGLFISNRITNLTNAKQTPRYGKFIDGDFDRGDFIFVLPYAFLKSTSNRGLDLPK